MPRLTARSIPPYLLPEGLVTIPAVATDLILKDCYIFQIVLCNKTAGAVTVTIIDKQTSAKTLLAAVSIAANTTYVAGFPEGILMKGGVNWVASAGSSIDAEVLGFYRA